MSNVAAASTNWQWHNGHPVARIERESHSLAFYLFRGLGLLVACAVLMAIVFVVGVHLGHQGRILPGVYVNNISVAGLEPTRAERRLRGELGAPPLGSEAVFSNALGEAYEVGRQGTLIDQAEETVVSLIMGIDVSPGTVSRADLSGSPGESKDGPSGRPNSETDQPALAAPLVEPTLPATTR